MMKKIFQISDKILTAFEEWTLFLSVMAALIALFFSVVLRYGFNSALPWSEELVREVIIYTTFIGCSAAVRNRTMIKIDASVQIFPKLKVPLTFFSNLVVLIFALIVLYYGWKTGVAANSDRAEDDHHADSLVLYIRDSAADGRHHDDPCLPGFLRRHRCPAENKKNRLTPAFGA